MSTKRRKHKQVKPKKMRITSAKRNKKKSNKASVTNNTNTRRTHKNKSNNYYVQQQPYWVWIVLLILFSICLIIFYYIDDVTQPFRTIFGSQILSNNNKNKNAFLDFAKYNHQTMNANPTWIESKQNSLTLQTLQKKSKEIKVPRIPLTSAAIVVKEWKHEQSDFTQGLEIISSSSILDASVNVNDSANATANANANSKSESTSILVLESTGLYDKSKLKIVHFPTDSAHIKDFNFVDHPTVRRSVQLDRRLFGEGCTIFVDPLTNERRIYQLTWKSKIALIYDMKLKKLREIAMPPQMKEGWGLYYDIPLQLFLATDGTSTIFFIDPKTFEVKQELRVKMFVITESEKSGTWNALNLLNEIEIINGWIFVNRWFDTNIYVISPFDGLVYGIIECEHLIPETEKHNRNAVLNGIAFDAVNNHIIVTGKLWSKMYSIELPAFVQ